MEALHLKLLNQSYPAAIFVFVGTFALLILSYNILWKRRSSAHNRLAPEPAGAWPLIGHLPLLFEPNLPHVTMGAWADKYGPVFSIRLGLHKALVINSWEAAKECFMNNDRAFATRPKSIAMKIMAYNYAILGFSPYNSYWREIRKLSKLHVLSDHQVNSSKPVMISEVDLVMKELYCTWRRSRDENKLTMVEMRQWFGELTLNVIVKIVAGKRYADFSLEKSEGRRLLQGIKDFFSLIGLFLVADSVPCLEWLDFGGHQKAMKRTAQELDSIMESWLQEHKRKKLAGEVNNQRDFMDVMLSVLEDNELFNKYDSDTVCKATCLAMILGGSDTIKVTMTWVLSLLLNNRHILKKAQDEIDTIVGKQRHVHVSDVEKLVYLQAIVKETLRLYPAGPVSVPHEAMEDCAVADYHVPAGTRLITNIWKIQRDPHIWPNPLDFHPERFLAGQADIDFRGLHFEFIPFGSGRRSCPGVSFGLQVVHLVLARLLQGFDLETPSNEAVPVDMTETAGMTNLKATPLQVLITPRLSLDLY